MAATILSAVLSVLLGWACSFAFLVSSLVIFNPDNVGSLADGRSKRKSTIRSLFVSLCSVVGAGIGIGFGWILGQAIL